MIEIKNISKKFDDKYVLDNLSCNINDNCIYGLVGINGAGKSTLLRIVNSIYNADSGIIYIDGNCNITTTEVKQKLAYVPDDLYFYNSYNLQDMAKIYRDMYPNFDMEYLKKLAILLKLDIKKKINTFSKGMKRQCSIICALATHAKYIFFDETFDGIDPIIRNVLKKIIIKQMDEDNTTIVLTSHNLRELEDICDNIGFLYDGGILFESDIQSIKTDMIKIQISLKKDFTEKDFKKLKVLSFKKSGSIATIIINDKEKKSKKILEEMNPIILDYLPLTLEEVFIYEMEALGYDFKEFI